MAAGSLETRLTGTFSGQLILFETAPRDWRRIAWCTSMSHHFALSRESAAMKVSDFGARSERVQRGRITDLPVQAAIPENFRGPTFRGSPRGRTTFTLRKFADSPPVGGHESAGSHLSLAYELLGCARALEPR